MIRSVAYAGTNRNNVGLIDKKKRDKLLKEGVGKNFKGLIFSAGIFLIGIAAFRSYLFMTTSPKFYIKKVDVEGHRSMKKKTIFDMIEMEPTQNIFGVDIAQISLRLKSHPWIRDVAVARKLPDRLNIKITERIPEAILKSDKSYLIDGDGMILEEINEEYAVGLPVIIDDRGILRKIGERVTSESFFASQDLLYAQGRSTFIAKMGIKSIRPMAEDKILLETRIKEITILFDSFNIPEGLRKLDTIAELTTDKMIELIDVSFNSLVVVR